MSQGFVFRVEGSVPSYLKEWGDRVNEYTPHNSQELVLNTTQGLLPKLYFTDAPKEILTLDFTDSNYRQLVKSFGKHQLLPKALGVPLGVTQVCDLTMGLGEDSWALASIGVRVYSFERHPLIGYLVERALEAARKDPALASIVENIHFRIGQAQDIFNVDLQTMSALFDPMFATEERKSKPSKEMQFMKAIVGNDPDQLQVCEWAIQHFKRLAIKRAVRQPPLGSKPQLEFLGRGVRFDVYLNN